MPSFDVVSEVDMQEIDNAINQAQKEISNRYDFKGSKAEIERSDQEVIVHAQDDYKLQAMKDVFQSKLVKRKVDLRTLDEGKIEQASGGTVRQKLAIQQGLDKEKAKKITKLIKGMKVKVQAQIQEDTVRVTGKKIDDLQSVIQSLKESKEVDLPLQYVNMRS
jgi:hypothetical protein